MTQWIACFLVWNSVLAWAGVPPENYYNFGNRLYALGLYRQAEAVYRQAADLPAAGKKAGLRQHALYNAGNAAFQQKRFQAAVDYYEKTLDLNPTDEDAWHNLEIARQILMPLKPKISDDPNAGPKVPVPNNTTPSQDIFSMSPEQVFELMREETTAGYPFKPGSSIRKKKKNQVKDEIDW